MTTRALLQSRHSIGAASLCAGLLVAPQRDGHAQRAPAADQRIQPSRSCGAPRWTPPRQLASSDGRAAYVETPRIVTTRAGIAMFGSPAFIWGSKESVSPPGVHTDIGRALRDFLLAGLVLQRDTTVEPIRMPPGVYNMEAPDAIPDGRGGVHVIWAAAADSASNQNVATMLRYAHFDGARWSAPERVLTAQLVQWQGMATKPIVLADTIHVGVTVFDANGGGGGIVYARRTAQGWRTTRLSRAGFPLFSTLAVDDGGAPVLAFTGSTPNSRKSDGQHLWVTRSADGGLGWVPPTLVHSSGLGSAATPRLVTSLPGRMYILWAQRREGAMLADSVLMATSRDGGRSWLRDVGIAVPEGVGALEALADADGRLHVTWTRATRGTGVLSADGEIVYATFDGREWTAPTSGIGSVASMPSLNLVSPDSLLLVWGVARPTTAPGIPAAEAPVGMLSILSPICSKEGTQR